MLYHFESTLIDMLMGELSETLLEATDLHNGEPAAFAYTHALQMCVDMQQAYRDELKLAGHNSYYRERSQTLRARMTRPVGG